jgi:hypothetical protein
MVGIDSQAPLAPCRGRPTTTHTTARIGSPNPECKRGSSFDRSAKAAPRVSVPAADSPRPSWLPCPYLPGGSARGLVDGEGDGSGRHVVRQIDNGVYVDIAERKIKALQLAAEAFDHLGGGVAARGAPFASDRYGALRGLMSFNQILGHVALL